VAWGSNYKEPSREYDMSYCFRVAPAEVRNARTHSGSFAIGKRNDEVVAAQLTISRGDSKRREP
jgi:hypothetical protein